MTFDMNTFTPKEFVNKDGIPYTTRPHYANFNNIHNASKSKVFMVLYHRRFKLGIATGLGVMELHQQSGVPYNTVNNKRKKWVEWGYLKRAIKAGKTRPFYSYSLTERGIHFVRDIIPDYWLQRYAAEIREFTSKQV